MTNVGSALILGFTVAALLGAQWLNYPTPGIPRLPDGKPDLEAPAPRTANGQPDLSELWEPAGSDSPTFPLQLRTRSKFQDVSLGMKGGLPLQPWAADLVKARRAASNKDDPDSHCQPL
jgi:hypothetical protein